jgi:thymidylate synthase (FAD)
MGKTLVGSDYFLPDKSELKSQNRLNRQGRGETLPESLRHRVLGSLEESYRAQLALASRLRELGVDEDIVQGTKGVGFYTFQYRTGDLHNWLHFLGLRLDAHAQEEIRAYAQICASFLERLFPTTHEAFQDYFLKGVTFTQQELEFLSGLVGSALTEFDFDDPNAYPRAFSMRARREDEASTKQRAFNRVGDELRSKLRYLLESGKENQD